MWIFHPRLHRILATHDCLDGSERLGQPIAQAARAHRRHSAIHCGVERGCARRVGKKGFEDFEVPHRCLIELEVIRRFVAGARSEIRDVPAQMLGQIMQHGARRADGRWLVFQAETVERSDFEMVAQRELGGFGHEHPIVVAIKNPARPCGCTRESAAGFHAGNSGALTRAATEQLAQRRRFARTNDFRGTQACQLGEQSRFTLDLGGGELARCQINHCQPVNFSGGINRREEIVPLGAQHPLIEMGARTEDLSDFAFDQLTRPRLFHLVADGDLPSGLENPADIGGCRMERQPAHRNALAFGQCQI